VGSGRSPSTVFTFTTELCVTYSGKIDMGLINVEECERRGVPIVRHIIGRGGPLFGDPSMFTPFVFHSLNDKTHYSSKKQATDLFTEVLKGTFAEFGLILTRSEHRPDANDLVVNTNKAATVLATSSKGCMIYFATILPDFNYDLAEKLLNVYPSKFVNKPHKTMREWVTTLKKELGRDVSLEELRRVLIKQIEEKFDVTLIEGELTGEEKELSVGLREKHESEEWTKGGRWSPVKDYGLR